MFNKNIKVFSKYHPMFKRSRNNKQTLFLHTTARVNEKTSVRGCGAYCLHLLVHLGFHLITSEVFSFKVHLQWHQDAEDAICTIWTPISSPQELKCYTARRNTSTALEVT
jgi:hypothetical protein